MAYCCLYKSFTFNSIKPELSSVRFNKLALCLTKKSMQIMAWINSIKQYEMHKIVWLPYNLQYIYL